MSAIISALKKALDEDPSNWQNRLALIEAYTNEDQKNEAVALLQNIDRLPDDAEGLIAAAKCYAKVGSPDAGDILDPLIEAQPNNPEAHLARAQIAHQFKDAAKAKEHYHQAKRLDANVSDPALGEAYGEVPEELPAEPAEATPVPTPPVAMAPPTEAAPTAATPVTEEPAVVPEVVEAEVAEEAGEDEVPVHTAHVVIPPHSADFDELREKEKILELKRDRGRQRDKIQALTMTILAHVGIVFLLGAVVVNLPQPKAPEIVAVASHNVQDEEIEQKKMPDPQPWKPTAASSAVTEVITSAATSDVAMPSVNPNAPTNFMSLGHAFTPSMDFALPGEETKMLFGQKIDGKVLGVIADVSGSMAEYLPKVLREVDKNFPKAPVVFVNHTRLRQLDIEGTDIWPIVAEDVVPRRENRNTPYWFLWGDLPRKAEQKSVDRLIEIFKTRPNSYLAVGGENRIGAGIEFLLAQKVDALYIFSDYEDFTDEEVAREYGKKLLRGKVKTYVQPAEEETEFLHVMTQRVVSRTAGRRLPPLIEVASRSTQEMIALEQQKKVEDVVRYATPRSERDTEEFYARRISENWQQLAIYEHENFDAVVYGPEARVHVYLKGDDGYIQRPMLFYYWSGKVLDDPRYGPRTHRRKFVRSREEPVFENNKITWLMEMESGEKYDKTLEFDIELTIKDNELVATYRAELMPDDVEGDNHGAYLYFHFPRLGHESKDLYYNYDYLEGLNLDQVREAVKVNTAVFHLPGQFEDNYGTTWNQLGFKRGYNERTFEVLIRRPPPGVRDIAVSGPSFGPRNIEIATTSNRLLLSTHFYRHDIELWEGFGARLGRPADRRERWTKTEAFRLTIE